MLKISLRHPRKPFRDIGILGLVVTTLVIFMYAGFPGSSQTGQLPQGFALPIRAFEFANDKARLLELFRPADPETQFALFSAMRFGLYADFAFAILYSLFLILFARRCSQISGSGLYWLGAALAGLAAVGDFFENAQMLEMLNLLAYSPDWEVLDLSSQLNTLHYARWLHYGSLTLCFLSFLPFLMREDWFGKLMGGAAALPPAFLLVFALQGSGAFIEYFVIAVNFSIIFLTMYSYAQERQPRRLGATSA